MSLTRRQFLKTSGLALGGSLILGLGADLLTPRIVEAENVNDLSIGPFIVIHSDNRVSLVCHRSEMGQGTRTAMPMILAEELDIAWEQVQVVQADGDAKYGDQNTDGSRSVRFNWTPHRTLGAAGRALMLHAAAIHWGVPVGTLRTEKGHVWHDDSGRKAAYGELIPLARKLPIPKNPPLKDPANFRTLGKAKPGIDLPAMMAGQATYGQDVRLPGMLYASIERAPTNKGRLKRWDFKEALKVPGVVQVVRLPPHGDPAITNEAVAVVATHTWAAIKGREALKLEWDTPRLDSSQTLMKKLDEASARPGQVFRNVGDFDAAQRTAHQVLEAHYRTPFLVHATMEPPACTARIAGDRCEIWAPTQDPQRARQAAASLLGWPVEKVMVHVTLLGGGFGRKSQPDFVLEAVGVARHVGKPVKVVWSRQDEIQHGFYHAPASQHLTATLSETGQLTGWRHRSAFPSIVSLLAPSLVQWVYKGPHEFEMGMGAANLPYLIPHYRCEGATVEADVRIGWFRSVCNLFHAFAINCFLDEIAHATRQDPVKLRLDLLDAPPIPTWEEHVDYPLDRRRLAHVIEVTARESGWHRPKKTGGGRGFACHYSFLSYVAVMVEVSAIPDGIRIDRVHITLDCGHLVNPDSVRAQMEGSVIFGLSAALYGDVTLDGGQVQQSNFHDYPVLRMSECPEIHVHLVESTHPPTGVGEPGVPPVAPALANAVFDAIGVRLRELPLRFGT